MGFFHTIIEVFSDAIKGIIDFLCGRTVLWGERRRYHEQIAPYIQQVLEQDAQYQPEQPDIDAAQRAKEYLAETFPNGIRERVANMSKDELLALFKEVEQQAEQILDISVDDVEFYSTDTPPECNYCGWYNHDSNSLHINVAMVLSGKHELIEEQIYNIFHELKHARQWAAVLGEKDYGYSDELLQKWGENMQNYIPPYESDEDYRERMQDLNDYSEFSYDD